MTAPAPRPLPYPWPEVRKRLQADLARLLPELGIRERASGGMVTPRNPTRDDKKPGSFVIWTEGPAAGAWKDFAVGHQGDVIDLVLYLGGLREKIDAYWWALAFLGLDRGVVRTAEAAELQRRRAEADRIAAEAKSAEALEVKSKRLFQHWLSLPPIAGTVAETYLREARNIPLERLPRQPGALRFCAMRDHFDEETGEVTPWPCMVSAMTRGKRVVGLHRTWLQPDGSGKAPVAKAKKMFGPIKGAAIRLTSGPSGLSPTSATAAGRLDPLIIGEGIETVLTTACARPDYRAWAPGSLSLMAQVEWPPCASGVVLLQDNDLGPVAQQAFARVRTWWEDQAQGRPFKVVASGVGNDFNDWARA